MQNSLALLILGTWLTLGASTQLRAQTNTTNTTNPPAATGVLASPVEFRFKSGSLYDFIFRIKEVFGINLQQYADLTEYDLIHRVPSMKLRTSKVWDVLNLYNQISDDYPGLGKWIQKRFFSENQESSTMPNAVIFVAPKQSDAEAGLSTRAFTLAGLSAENQKLLLDTIEEERDLMEHQFSRGVLGPQNPSLIRGSAHINSGAGILVATGTKAYVEMVTSLVDAFREANRASAPTYPTKPKTEK